MAVVFDGVKAGDVLYDVHRERMGNTTMRRTCVYVVNVKEVDQAARKALCSWNGNAPKWFYAAQVRKWRRSPPKGHQ